MLREQESAALFETEERIRALAKARRAGDSEAAARLATEVAALSPSAARATASAFAVYFDLVNLAEEAHRIRALRERERSPASGADRRVGRRRRGPVAGRGRHTRADGRAAGAGCASSWCSPRIPPRPSAEPCCPSSSGSARRCAASTIPICCRASGTRLRAALQAEITALWLTDRARTARPAVTDEVRTGLYFVDAVLLGRAAPHRTTTWTRRCASTIPAWPRPPAGSRWPRGSAATATATRGRDRRVTAETLRLHRGLAVERHRRGLQDAGAPAQPERSPLSAAAGAGRLAAGAAAAAGARGLSRAALRRRALPPGAGAAGRRSRGGVAGRHDRAAARRGAASGARGRRTRSRACWT